MTNEINKILTQLPKIYIIHALNDALYCWNRERKAKKRLYYTRKQAKEHRQQFLDEQIRRSYHNQHPKKARQIKSISNAEIQSYMLSLIHI